MILAQSSENKGVCYVETKNLDGETNLKHKTAVKAIHSELSSGNDIPDLENVIKGMVICEKAND
jgi:magnesium-transporting ATPase (P-type)